VLFDGYLVVNDPDPFREALQRGIGHGRALGLGLLSVVPIL
jgi:CRISPR system Cascade subunit CasE